MNESLMGRRVQVIEQSHGACLPTCKALEMPDKAISQR